MTFLLESEYRHMEFATKFNRRIVMKEPKLMQDITDYTYNNIVYKAYSSEIMKKIFHTWEKELSFREKIALKLYRMNNCLKFNINAKLRNGKNPKNANVISNALDRAELSEDIIVYRLLAKDENTDMQKYKEGDVYICKDFKGTHVKTQIKERRKQGFSAGYMFILIPRNSRVAYINDVTRYSRGEKELLIDKNQKYQLLKKFDFFNRNGYLVRLINE